MKSMKMEKKQAEQMGDTVKSDTPEYPYGLKIHLDNECLKRLALEELPEIGEEMMLVAKVQVTDVHQSERQGEGPYMSVGLQITDMELSEAKEEKDTSSVFYG